MKLGKENSYVVRRVSTFQIEFLEIEVTGIIMKRARHIKIKQIIDEQIIETQEDLLEALRENGVDVTQATVSRDIKELLLIKTPVANGKSRYALPQEQDNNITRKRLERTFHDSVNKISVSETLIVIKTLAGTAQSVAVVIDFLKIPEVLGTVAGDDTIFVAIDAKKSVATVLNIFQKLAD